MRFNPMNRRRHWAAPILLAALATGGLLQAQAAHVVQAPPVVTIVVTGDRPVSDADPDRPHVEPFVAVDPTDARHMVAAAILANQAVGPAQNCAVFTTFDGGIQWSKKALGLPMCADPGTHVGHSSS